MQVSGSGSGTVMFKSEPQLFFSAVTNLCEALDILKVCEEKVYSSDLYTSEYDQLKKCVSECDIEGLVELVNNDANNICQFDNSFAASYVQLCNEHWNSLLVDGEQNADYSNDTSFDIYLNYLYTILDSNKDNLSSEQLEVYNSLKDRRDYEEICNELEAETRIIDSFDFNDYSGNSEDLWAAQDAVKPHAERQKELLAKKENLERKMGIYINKWYEDISDAVQTTAISWASGIDTLINERNATGLLDAFHQTLATYAVINENVLIGAPLSLLEKALDGTRSVYGSIGVPIIGLFDKKSSIEAQESIMNTVGTDYSGNLKKKFYEKTKLGNKINEYSNLKYDSAGASFIQDAIEGGVIAVGASAAMLASGGTAAPVLFVVGGFIGAGEEGEKRFSDKKNRNFSKDSLMVNIEFFKSGVETVMKGKMGASLVNGFKIIRSPVGKELFSTVIDATKNTIGKKNLSKVFLNNIGKAAVESFNELDLYTDTLALSRDDIESMLYNGFSIQKSFNILSNFGKSYVVETAYNFLGLGASDFLRDYSGSKRDYRCIYELEDMKKNNPYVDPRIREAIDIRIKELEKSVDTLNNRNPKLLEIYYEGMDMGRQYSASFSFDEHSISHVVSVAEEGRVTAQMFNEAIDRGLLPKSYGKVDENVIYNALLAHDLGMMDAQNYNDDLDFKATCFDDGILNPDKVFMNKIRKKHSMTSAEIVISNRDIFESETEEVAVLAYLHSKSCSGAPVLSKKAITQAIENLDKWSKEHKLPFDKSIFGQIDATGKLIMSDDSYYRLKTGVTVSRSPDAHVSKKRFNQGNMYIYYEDTDASKQYTKDIISGIAAPSLEAEAKKAKISFLQSSGKVIYFDEQSKSVNYILGENNAHMISEVITDDGKIQRTYKVDTYNNPASTWILGICERFAEYVSFGDIQQEIIIELPKDTPDRIKKYYEVMAGNASKSPFNYIEDNIRTDLEDFVQEGINSGTIQASSVDEYLEKMLNVIIR